MKTMKIMKGKDKMKTMKGKDKMKTIITILILSLSLQSYAVGQSGPDLSRKTTLKQKSQQQQQVDSNEQQRALQQSQGVSAEKLEKLYEDGLGQLKVVEELLESERYGQAYKRASELIRSVQKQSGISPFTGYQEKIYVKNNTFRFEDLKTPYGALNNSQKENVQKAVAAHKGGFYMDILNLLKTTNVLYVKAYFHANKENLYNTDIDLLRKELVATYHIPILIQDGNRKSSLMVFDSDIVDRKVQISFNKSLKDVALGLNELNFSDESAFEEFANLMKKDKLQSHIKGVVRKKEIKKQKPKPTKICGIEDDNQRWFYLYIYNTNNSSKKLLAKEYNGSMSLVHTANRMASIGKCVF